MNCYYIIGFGLALYIIVGEEALYSNPFKAIYAAFYGSISDLNIRIISDKEANNTLRYPITTYITILFFNISVSITLINLLIGIAVQKTATIQDRALLYQGELRVQLFLELDLIIPEFLQYKIYPKEHNIKRSNGLGINRKFGDIWNSCNISQTFLHTMTNHQMKKLVLIRKTMKWIIAFLNWKTRLSAF